LQGNLSDGRRPILDQKQLCGLSQLLRLPVWVLLAVGGTLGLLFPPSIYRSIVPFLAVPFVLILLLLFPELALWLPRLLYG